MIKFADYFPRVKHAKRDQEWNRKARGDGHIATSFLNLPQPQVEEQIPGTPPFIPFFAETDEMIILGDTSMFMPGGAPHP